MNTPQITVVIPAHNAAGTLADALDGLDSQDFTGGVEVVVVDDGSDDDTGRMASEARVVDRVLRLEGAGPAAARNAGAAAARAPRLAFLDADCRPTSGWLSAGVRALDSADLVVGETRPRPDRALGPFDRTLWVVGSSPLFESANLFVQRGLFDRLDGFEGWLGPRDGKELGEDVWFGWRAMRAGARIASCPKALVHHEVFPRGALDFAAERWRLRFFPALVDRIPELRRAAFHRRWFLTARSARFDAALLGLGLAVASRRPLPLLAAVPYTAVLARELGTTRSLRLPAANVTADAVGFAGLLVGSLRSRSVLL